MGTQTDSRVFGNWIGGERVGAADGDRFRVTDAADPWRSVGSWPRSRTADVAAALASIAASSWQRTDARARLEVVRRAAGEVLRDPDPSGKLGAALGLSADELAQHATGLRDALQGPPASWPERSARAAAAGALLAAPHWSELFGGYVDPLRGLVQGRRVCLFSSAPVPALADRIAEALLDAGVDARAFALLHDDSTGALRCALESGGFGDVSCGGEEHLRALLERWMRVGSASSGAPFGAGVVATPGTANLAFRDLADATRTIEIEEPTSELAAEVVERAFGRSVLGGQLPGRVGLVRCRAHAFSRFTAALLEALAVDQSGQGKLYVDPEARAGALRLRELGLDEGATLIHEEAREAGSPAPLADVRLGRFVFTNVEPGMRLASPWRPSPVLLLSRAKGGPR